MTISPVKHFRLRAPAAVSLTAAALVVVTCCLPPAMAAETADTWPFGETDKDDRAWPFNRNQTAPSAGTPSEAPAGESAPAAPRRGPTSILPPAATGNDTDTDAGETGMDMDMTLFPAGPSASDRDLPAVRALEARPGEAGTGIEMGSLGQVDESSAGLLDRSNGGLGVGMWAGTDRQLVERTLDRIPGPTQSPVMGDLARRLLLTAARAPQGASGSVSLLALRLQRLNAAGRADEVVQLMMRAGGAQPSPAAAVEFALAALSTGDTALACNMLGALPVGGDPSNDPVAAFALKLSIFCQISGGQSAAANLTADLAREQGFEDRHFLALAAAATEGLTLDAPAPGSIDPLSYRMMGLAGRALKGDGVARLEPALLTSVAGDGSLEPEIRVAAAERAAALGLITGDEMAAAYLSFPYTRDDVGGIRIGREPASPYRRRALFHQAILDERVPAGRADLLSALLIRETGGPAYRATLIAHRGSLASVPPSAALSAFAPLASRAFIDLGDRVRAGMWLTVLEDQGAAPRQARELRALLRLIDPGAFVVPVPQDGAMPAYVRDALRDLPAGGRARDFAALEIVLVDALGGQLPASVWDALLTAGDLPGGAVPPLAVTRRLRLASAEGRVGETVLLALAALSEGGPPGTHPQSLGEIVTALQKVGLDAEARRVGVEALGARMAGEN